MNKKNKTNTNFNVEQISKVEHQAQHQQHVSLEGIENSNARAVLVKLINMALTLLQLVLVVVSTAANIISPFLKTRQVFLPTKRNAQQKKDETDGKPEKRQQ